MLAKLLWNSANLALLTLIVSVVVVLCTIWLYPPQTRALGKRWQWLLPTLRVAALLLLAISLLKPTLLRPRTADEQAAIVLMVDRSQSMGVSDRERSPGEQVAICDALGALPPGSRTVLGSDLLELLSAIKPQLDETSRLIGDLEYARLSGSGEDRAARRLEQSLTRATTAAAQITSASRGLPFDDAMRKSLDELAKPPDGKSRMVWVRRARETVVRTDRRLTELQRESDRARYDQDASVKTACQTVSAATRLDLSERAVVSARSGILDSLPADTPLFGFSFGDQIQPLPLRAKGQPVRQLGLQPVAPASDLVGAIGNAIDSLKGRQIQGVIVFTDGRQAGAVTASTGQLGLRGIPVFPVAIASDNALKDVSIDSIAAPAGPFVGETITVRVAVRSLNLPAGGVEVKLKLGDVEQTRRVDLPPTGLTTAEFEIKLDKPGVQELSVSIPHLDGEASIKNNTAQRLIKVHADKVRILAVCGYTSWDYQYIRNAVARSAWAKLTERVIDPGETLTFRPEQIRDQDVILLFNVPASSLRPEQIDQLHQAVTKTGVSLFLAMSDVAMLDEYAAHPLLGELLPYRQGQRPTWRSWPGEEPAFRVTPAKAVESQDFMRLADDAEISRRRWVQAPAIYRYMVLPELKPNVIRPLLVEKDSSLPILTESRLGMGRVFFLGLDESWRWRRRVGERDQDRLWLQLIRYSTDEPYACTAGRLALDIDRVTAPSHQPVRARLRLDLTDRPDAAAVPSPQLTILQDGQTIREERLSAATQYSTGRFEAQIRDLPDGHYTVQASVGEIGGDGPQTLTLPLVIGRDEAAELANLSPDLQLLQQIARATGGDVLSLHEVREIPRRLSGLREKTPATIEIPLWDGAPLFLLVLALLGAEWAIRKRLGLP